MQKTGTIVAALQEILAAQNLAVLVTVIEATNGVGAKLLVTEDGTVTGTFGNAVWDAALAGHAPGFLATRAEARTYQLSEILPQADATVRVLCERIEPEPRLLICGAGHVGAALARLALVLQYHTTLIDDRATFVTRERFPDVRLNLVAAESWTHAIETAGGTGRGLSVAVVTRGHNEDEECLRAVLSLRPDYVGMIGSRRRTNIVLERLRQTGFSKTQVNVVRAPVGLDIGAVSPEEVALAILSEIVAERRGGTGSPLSAWRRPVAENTPGRLSEASSLT